MHSPAQVTGKLRAKSALQWARWAWAGLFLTVVVTGSTIHPPSAWLVCAGALAGLGIAALEPARLAAMVKDDPILIATSWVLAASLLASALYWHWNSRPGEWVPAAQAGLLLCIVPLAVFMRQEPRVRMLVLVFACGLGLWHVFAMPVEALSGMRMSWRDSPLLERSIGPLRFQAAGLAEQSYFFPGLLLPLFYLAWGDLAATARLGDTGWGRQALRIAALLWLAVAACVQSRSALAGASVATALVLLIGPAALRGRTRWLLIFSCAAVVGILYALLFAHGKTGPGLRWAYAMHYVAQALEWPGIVLGHGSTLPPAGDLLIPPQPLDHSHNDFVQVLYSFGLVVLLAYCVFLLGLARLAWTLWRRHGQVGFICALAAVLPNMLTDLGLHHYEKAAFLVLATGWAMAAAGGRPRHAPAAIKP
jgi:hypothetical protein